MTTDHADLPADLPPLPERSTGWKKGTVQLSCSTGPKEVPGFIKGGFGVSRGENGDSTHRLTQLRSGCVAFFGPPTVCKRLADALHEHVPTLETLENSDSTRIPKDELDKLHHLLRLARLA